WPSSCHSLYSSSSCSPYTWCGLFCATGNLHKTKHSPSIGAALRDLKNAGIVPAAAIRDASTWTDVPVCGAEQPPSYLKHGGVNEETYPASTRCRERRLPTRRHDQRRGGSCARQR